METWLYQNIEPCAEYCSILGLLMLIAIAGILIFELLGKFKKPEK